MTRPCMLKYLSYYESGASDNKVLGLCHAIVGTDALVEVCGDVPELPTDREPRDGYISGVRQGEVIKVPLQYVIFRVDYHW